MNILAGNHQWPVPSRTAPSHLVRHGRLGCVLLNDGYCAASRKAIGPGALTLVRANAKATKIAEVFIYAVPILGFALVGMSEDAWGFDQTWVRLSTVVYAVALAISVELLVPSARQYERIVAESENAGAAPTSAVEAALDGLLEKQAVLGSTLHVITVVLLVSMIWKPGA